MKKESTEATRPGSESGEAIRHDPVIAKLIGKMPSALSESFTDEQLESIRASLIEQEGARHIIDLRWTLALFRWRYYFVLLFGRNRRKMTRIERSFDRLMQTILVTLFCLLCVMLGLIVIYFFKSALGIDLVPSESLGLWNWLKNTF
jgi:hypothetical protein